MPTIDNSLTLLAKKFGVTVFDENDTAGDLIAKVAGGVVFGGSNPVTVAAATAESYFGVSTASLQTEVSVANGKITGTLHKLTTKNAITDVWGKGWFIALKFTKNNASASEIDVGLKPSVSSGLVALDADMDGVFKITNKDNQVFVVSCTDGEVVYEQNYDLSELVLANS